jgi:hypothetical protein
MKHLNEVFEDAEYDRLLKAKNGSTWRKFILEKCLGE